MNGSNEVRVCLSYTAYFIVIPNKRKASPSLPAPLPRKNKPIPRGIKEFCKENRTILTFRKIQDLVQILQTRWQVMSMWCLLPESCWFNGNILFRKVRRTREVILEDWVGLCLRFCRKEGGKKSDMSRTKQQLAAWIKTGAIRSHFACDCQHFSSDQEWGSETNLWWSHASSIRFIKQS